MESYYLVQLTNNYIRVPLKNLFDNSFQGYHARGL